MDLKSASLFPRYHACVVFPSAQSEWGLDDWQIRAWEQLLDLSIIHSHSWENTEMHGTQKIKNSYKIKVPVTFLYFNVLSIPNLKRDNTKRHNDPIYCRHYANSICEPKAWSPRNVLLTICAVNRIHAFQADLVSLMSRSDAQNPESKNN